MTEEQKEKNRKRAREWYKKHKDKADAWYHRHKKRMRELARLRWKKLRIRVINFLGGKCSGCGIADERVLQVDHKRGGGTKHRKSMGGSAQFKIYKLVLKDIEHKKFQLLCANCNWIKRLELKEDRK